VCVESHLSRQYSNTKLKCVQQRLPDFTWPFVLVIYLFVLLITVVLLFIISIYVKSQLYLFMNLHEFLVIIWWGIHISLGVFAILRRIYGKFSTLVLFHKQFRAHKKKLECSFEYLLFFC
jgi:hypothetical protein